MTLLSSKHILHRDFVEAYRDAQQEINEYACETQKETCEYQCQNGQYQYQNEDNQYNYNNNNNNNNNNGDNYCYYTCMYETGMSFCEDENENNQNMDELMECRQLGGDNNNQNNQYYYNANYEIYYVGPYCTSDGVYVGTFTDSQCSHFAPAGTYEKYYGYSLPTTNMVGTDCISCKDPGDNNNGQNNNNNNNNNNYYQQDEVFEFCQELYEEAGKCEEKMVDHQYPNNNGCELMHVTLARLDSAMHNSRRPAVGFAWFFGVSLAVLSSYVVWMHVKLRKHQQDNQVNLLPTFPGTSMS
jgi:hypothetical protein